MREIIQEYEIAVKVQNIVTDNGLNFVKAMKTYLETFTPEQQTALLPIASASQNASNGSVSTLFQPPIDPEILNLLTENSEESNTETLKETNDDPSLFDVLSFSPTTDFDEDLSSLPSLPSHIRCASHTLNLLATTDVEEVLTLRKDERFAQILKQSMKKMKSLWTRCNMSTRSCDIMKTELRKSNAQISFYFFYILFYHHRTLVTHTWGNEMEFYI